MNWEDIDRYRRMVDAVTDSVLHAWGRMMRMEEGDSLGHKRYSIGFSSGGLRSFEDLEESCETLIARSAQSIIYDVSFAAHRTPIIAVYAAAARLPDEIQFLEAVQNFERIAKVKGLV